MLHGWPQHHYAYRDLLADPPPGVRIIAPDLPGYGWSGPAPHRWAKQDRRQRRPRVARRARARADRARGARLGRLHRLPDGAARPRPLQRLHAAEHRPPVADAAHDRCRTSGGSSSYQPLHGGVRRAAASPHRASRAARPARRLDDEDPIDAADQALVRRPLPRSGLRPRGAPTPTAVPAARAAGGARAPRHAARRSRSAGCSASTTPPSTARWRRRGPRAPTTTRSSSSRTAGTSSPRSAPTWSARGSSRWRTGTIAARTSASSGTGPKPRAARSRRRPPTPRGRTRARRDATTSNGRASPRRSSATSATSSASSDGPRSIGNTPSQRAARRNGLRLGQRAASQNGIRGTLHRARQQRPGVDDVVLAGDAHRLTGHAGVQQRQRLVEHRAADAVIGLLAEARQLAAAIGAEAQRRGPGARRRGDRA